ncbi:hypothetical protein QQP08_000249 [Theobroma cacao]|nr:hypothetical protein QQP08_000249 [Theobroma cacao]
MAMGEWQRQMVGSKIINRVTGEDQPSRPKGVKCMKEISREVFLYLISWCRGMLLTHCSEVKPTPESLDPTNNGDNIEMNHMRVSPSTAQESNHQYI